MINKIRTYYIILATAALAILVYLFQRRGSSINDLKRERLNKQMNDQLKEIQEKVSRGEKNYADDLQKYRNLRDAYDSVPRKD